jgi:hypothetical protein
MRRAHWDRLQTTHIYRRLATQGVFTYAAVKFDVKIVSESKHQKMRRIRWIMLIPVVA